MNFFYSKMFNNLSTYFMSFFTFFATTMRNIFGISVSESLDDLLAKVAANLNGENDEEEQPDREFLEPHLACEIYAALPAAQQRRLLTLCRDIAELGPSPDGWTKWMISKWSGNRWDAIAEFDQYLQLSADGLKFVDTVVNKRAFVRAIQCVHFLPLRQMERPQICYFELKVRGTDNFITFGFRAKDWGNPPTLDIFVICNDAIDHVGHAVRSLAEQLPNIRISKYESAVVGCGLVKHLGKVKVFFTKDGKFFVDPIPLPPTTPDVPLFPFVNISLTENDVIVPVETNFGLKPFQFKFKGNEEKLLQ